MKLKKYLTVGDAIKFIESNQLINFNFFDMSGDSSNIMVILSSPSGAGKTTITKKSNKNIIHLSSQFPILQENQDQTK